MRLFAQEGFTTSSFHECGSSPILIVLVIVALTSAVFISSKQPKGIPGVDQSLKTEALSAIPLTSPSATPFATASATPSAIIKPKPTVTPSAMPAPTKAPQPVVTNNTPPGSGYSLQNASAEGKTYKVALIAADLNSTRVIVDSASDSDCAKDCPVLSLGDYVGRNGAWAGINGSYFCPADYDSCSDKKNSFDTLLMNKNKHYFNSDNNVYSTVPAAIFMAGGSRFVGQSLEWGRDSGVDSVIANYPLLVRGGNINFTEAPDEPKFGGAASRTFIAAKVLQAMGMQEALNLDQGGSTALWHGGYKAGPGRNIPNAVLFVNR